MFFFFSVYNDEKRLDFNKRLFCPICNLYDDFYITMAYSSFSLFFIPIFKFNKRYFLRTSRCNSFCEISADYAKRIIDGEDDIDPFKTPFVTNYRKEKRCENCGYTTTEDFLYCPKCSMRLK